MSDLFRRTLGETVSVETLRRADLKPQHVDRTSSKTRCSTSR